MTEQERREHFAFLNGVAADMKESRKEIIDLLEGIKAEIKERKLKSGGEPNRELAFNVCLKIIDRHIKEYME